MNFADRRLYQSLTKRFVSASKSKTDRMFYYELYVGEAGSAPAVSSSDEREFTVGSFVPLLSGELYAGGTGASSYQRLYNSDGELVGQGESTFNVKAFETYTVKVYTTSAARSWNRLRLYAYVEDIEDYITVHMEAEE